MNNSANLNNMKCYLRTLFLSMMLPLSNQVHATTEAYNTGWQLNIDNNIFTRYMKDRDYTGGIAFTATGSRAQSGWLNIDLVRGWVFDNLSISERDSSVIKKHSVQYGMVLFTPDDISATQPVLDDRPFASLFYISNTELSVHTSKDKAYRSSLTIGLLGLDLAGEVQGTLHEITGSDEANGWDNQISSGGEPTAMLTLSVQDKQSNADRYQLSTHLEGNVGFSTDVNAGLNWRWGRLNTPWWSFNPSHHEYISSAASNTRGVSGSKPEFYVFASANIKYRFYSSLLQGQFRESVHSLDSGQVEQLLGSVSTGVTREFGDNLRVSLFVRGVSAEIKGPNARELWWASLVINRAW
jgi:hypothetical protein